MAEVDLGRLAAAYDHRRGSGADRATTTARVVGIVPGSVVVDIGGGRGDHAAVFRSMGASAVVVDRSPDMARAAAQTGIDTVVGMGESLPIASGCARLAYFHLSIHHGDTSAMLGEACRITEVGGTVWVWTLDPARLEESYLARWFPSVAAIDRRRMPQPSAIAAVLEVHHLVAKDPLPSVEHIARSAGSWAEAVRSGFVSTLHLVDPTEIDEGLDRFGREHPDPDEVIEYDIFYTGVHGTRPGLVS